MKKSKPQIEIKWPEPESFALVIQTATDGDRVSREQSQRIADQQHAENQQPQLV